VNGDLDDWGKWGGKDAKDLFREFIDEFRLLRKIPLHSRSEIIGYYHGM
jgi:hypothetical protein